MAFHPAGCPYLSAVEEGRGNPLNRLIRLLLVDDEEQFILNLSKVLRMRGFDVSIALSGHEAIEAIESQGKFDVVVLDVKMPGMDGIETLGKIKELTPDTEVIMLTGQATLDSGVQAIRKGAYDYLMKPCDIEDLTRKITDAEGMEEIRRHPILWARNRVEEIIRPFLVRLESTDSLAKALEVLDSESEGMAAEILFVTDREDRLLGFVTKRNLMDEAKKSGKCQPMTWSELCKNPALLPEKTLAEVMHTGAVTVHPDERLTDVAHKMITDNFRSMPVVQEGKVIGIVRFRDILSHIEHEIE